MQSRCIAVSNALSAKVTEDRQLADSKLCKERDPRDQCWSRWSSAFLAEEVQGSFERSTGLPAAAIGATSRPRHFDAEQ